MQATATTGRRVDEESMAAALFAAYYPRVVRYAAKRRVEDAELTASHALYQGFRWAQDRHRLRQAVEEQDPAFEAYVFRCATNKVADEKRRKRFDLVPLDDSHGVADPVDELEVMDSLDAFHRLVRHLTDAERAVIEHRFVDGMSAAQIADATGRSIPAVRRLQYTGFLRLKGVLMAVVVLMVAVATYLLVDFSQRSVSVEPVESVPVETIPIDGLTPTTAHIGKAEMVERQPFTVEGGGEEADAVDGNTQSAPITKAEPPTTAIIGQRSTTNEQSTTAVVPPADNTAVPSSTTSAPSTTVAPSTTAISSTTTIATTTTATSAEISTNEALALLLLIAALQASTAEPTGETAGTDIGGTGETSTGDGAAGAAGASSPDVALNIP